jgi:hypothetical protein
MLTSYEDRADELHGKHTLFGRVIGDTIYSEMIDIFNLLSLIHFIDVVKIGEMGKTISL